MHFPQVNTLYFSSKTAYQHNSYSRNDILLKTSKVICSEINNASFTNDPPFEELGNPVCNVPMEAMIFINHKGWMCSLDTKNLPSETNSHCFNIMKERSPSINKVVVIIHGYLGNFNLQWLHDMKDAIQSVEDTTAVIVSFQFELKLKETCYWVEISNKKITYCFRLDYRLGIRLKRFRLLSPRRSKYKVRIEDNLYLVLTYL